MRSGEHETDRRAVRGNAVFRALCATIYYAFAQHLPAAPYLGGRLWSALRAALIRGFVLRAGHHLDVSRHVDLGFGRGIEIGHFSSLGRNAELHGPLVIGDHVMISPSVMVHTRNHRSERLDIPIGEQGYTEWLPVVLGDDTWVGARAILLPGVQLGVGCIVGAGAVVAKSFGNYQVVVGNPGRVVRAR